METPWPPLLQAEKGASPTSLVPLTLRVPTRRMTIASCWVQIERSQTAVSQFRATLPALPLCFTWIIKLPSHFKSLTWKKWRKTAWWSYFPSISLTHGWQHQWHLRRLLLCWFFKAEWGQIETMRWALCCFWCWQGELWQEWVLSQGYWKSLSGTGGC